jgi:hypothetical protein
MAGPIVTGAMAGSAVVRAFGPRPTPSSALGPSLATTAKTRRQASFSRVSHRSLKRKPTNRALSYASVPINRLKIPLGSTLSQAQRDCRTLICMEKGMRAAKILAGCTYSPESLETIGKAFDDAWASVAEHFAGDARRTEAARERLAHAVLVAATGNCRDAEPIKTMALQILVLSYRGSWLDPDSKFSRPSFPPRSTSPSRLSRCRIPPGALGSAQPSTYSA